MPVRPRALPRSRLITVASAAPSPGTGPGPIQQRGLEAFLSALLPSTQGSRAVSVLVAWSCRLVTLPTLPHPDPGERPVVGCPKPADLFPSSQLRKLNAETHMNSQTIDGIYLNSLRLEYTCADFTTLKALLRS